MLRLTAILVPLLLAGCAGQSAMRSTSAQSAAMLIQYRQSFADFADGQNKLNIANQERLGNLASITGRYQSEIDRRRQLWEAIDAKDETAKLKLYGAVRADDILNAGGYVNAQPTTVSPAALKFESAQIDALVKKLLELQKKASLKDRIGDFAAFTSAFRTSLEASVAKTADQATSSTAVADAVTGSALSQAAAADATPTQ